MLLVERRLQIVVGDLHLVLHRFRRHRQNADLAEFRLGELGLVVVVEALQVLIGGLRHRSGGGGRDDHVAQDARLVVVVVERVEEHLGRGRCLADRAQQLAPQIAFAFGGEIALLAHVESCAGLLQGERIEIAGRVLEGRILHDALRAAPRR